MSKVEIDLSNLPNVINDTFYPLLPNKQRYLVLKGGGGSGKSVFAAQKIIVRMLAEPGHRFLVVRKVAKTLRESVFAELRNVIYTWGMRDLFQIPKGNSSELHIKCINGNEILFAGLDDVEKLKSIVGITGIWIEEASELEPGDFRQLDIRLRGKTQYYKQIILSFNPVSTTHWLKTEFFDTPKANAKTHHSTYKDNRFLDDESKRVLEGFRDIDDYYYAVYCLGEWGVLGKTIFPAKIVAERIAELRDKKPVKQGFFVFDYQDDKILDDTIKWVDEDKGYITIYQEPLQGHPYVIGGDTAGEGSDYFAGQVLDNASGIQVAVLHHQFDEDLYTRQMYCLGKYFNYAQIGIETNFSTFPTKELQRLRYVHQFMREVIDRISLKREERFGFKTDKVSRPYIIANLVKVVREQPELFSDIATLEEMLTFVRNEKGKAEAQEGKTDDLIISIAIAHHIRDQFTTVIKVPEPEQTTIQRDKERLAKARMTGGARRRVV